MIWNVPGIRFINDKWIFIKCKQALLSDPTIIAFLLSVIWPECSHHVRGVPAEVEWLPVLLLLHDGVPLLVRRDGGLHHHRGRRQQVSCDWSGGHGADPWLARSYSAHRVILSTCSAYFRSLFSTVAPHQHPVLVLHEMASAINTRSGNERSRSLKFYKEARRAFSWLNAPN